MFEATIVDKLEVKVVVERGAIDRLAEILEEATPYKLLIITDENTGRYWLDRTLDSLSALGADLNTIIVPGGEECKRVEVAVKVWNKMVEEGVTRDSMVVGLGGGAVLDLAGFAASTYMRGCQLAYVPTTLLAQADASVGGKTGVNLEGKNIVGTFYHPHYVIVDPQTLSTLPEEEYRSGLAEIVKHAVIEGRSFFNWLRSRVEELSSMNQRAVEEAVKASLKTKLKIVTQDYREKGLRMILNFGHTLGHALEKTLNYKVSHGKAVSMGMVLEAILATEITGFPPGEADEIKDLLRRLGLPVNPPIPASAMLENIRLDKKVTRGSPVLALPERIGRFKLTRLEWEVLRRCISTLKL